MMMMMVVAIAMAVGDTEAQGCAPGAVVINNGKAHATGHHGMPTGDSSSSSSSSAAAAVVAVAIPAAAVLIDTDVTRGCVGRRSFVDRFHQHRCHNMAAMMVLMMVGAAAAAAVAVVVALGRGGRSRQAATTLW